MQAVLCGMVAPHIAKPNASTLLELLRNLGKKKVDNEMLRHIVRGYKQLLSPCASTIVWKVASGNAE